MSNLNISALLITLNEDKHIYNFLQQASIYANEIIIIDSFSDDNTKYIIENYANKNNIKIIFQQRKFDNFTNQRNYALSLASNHWVTFFDADEYLSSKLILEIKNTVINPNYIAYYVYRNFYCGNKLIKYCGIRNEKVVRLFDKRYIIYNNSLLVHEKILYNGEIGFLKNKLDHYTCQNFDEYLNKLNSYSKLRAIELKKKGVRPNIFIFILKSYFRFFKYYVLNFGFLDGIYGYKISIIHAKHVFNRYKFLKKLYR